MKCSIVFVVAFFSGSVFSFLPHHQPRAWMWQQKVATSHVNNRNQWGEVVVLHSAPPSNERTSVTKETSGGASRRPFSRGGFQGTTGRWRDDRSMGGRNRQTGGRYYGNERRSQGPPRSGSGGGGGGGSPAMRLVNPLKIKKIPVAPRVGPPSRSSSAATASKSARGPIGTGDDFDVSLREDGDSSNDDNDDDGGGGEEPSTDTKRPRRSVGKDKKKSGAYHDDNRYRRPSLRIGTGKRGRRAEMSGRRGSLKRKKSTQSKAMKEIAAVIRNTVTLPDGPITVAQLAELIDEKPIAVIKFLMTDLGIMAAMTQTIDTTTCTAVVEGFGKIVGGEDEEDDDELEDDSALSTGYVADEDNPDDMVPRAPVVTIMGHVDHGKTSLLDTIRNTRVTAGEAGGITQHIAAYQVEHNGNTITFIDTPGHAAFTDMRERGANITDIVILVVAADDSVKQQTADSILCARQAGVPLVVAINKMDLEGADPVRVMTDLTSYDVLTEDFGGDVLCSQISAKHGTNLDDLLDKVMLQAELEELRANPNRNAEGVVVEAQVERGLGTRAVTLIQKGTIRVGDCFVAGASYGKVRALIGTDGKTRCKEAGPSTPVGVVGFEGVPSAGDTVLVLDDEQAARELAESRQRIAREKDSNQYQVGLMGSVSAGFSGGGFKERKEMCVVVKADVQGSAEALTHALRALILEDEESVVTIKVLVSETGEVSKSDIAVASITPGTTVLAFGVAASYEAMEDARINNVPIEYYNIIYDAIESVESRMQEVLSPTPDGKLIGSAIVQEVFNIGGTGNIAGCRCQNGYIRKGANVRVMRRDKILTGGTKVKTLRNFKAEADRIEEGNECGIGLIDFEEFEAGDVIECYVEM